MSEALLSDRDLVDEVGVLGSEQRAFLRDSARNDLYVLAKGILGYPDVTPRVHRDFCRFYDSEQHGADGRPLLRRLGLMPRGHLKSTLATIADSIRIVLADPDHARVLIANETATTANKFLAEIKGHFEKNELLRKLFPELIPDRFTGPGVTWSAERASVIRNTPHKEPSWQAIGVGGAIVGAHFTRIKCDDLIGFEASESEAVMRYTIAWNDNIESLLVDQHRNMIDWIGTRWKRRDLYSHIMDGYGAELAVYTREAIEDGEIIFPELHTWEEYERIQRINPAQWAAQYANNPLAEDQQEFPASALRTAKFSADGSRIVLDHGTEGAKIWPVRQLNIVVAVDPNSGKPTAPDPAVVMVLAITPDEDFVVLDYRFGRPSPSELVDWTFEKVQRWRPGVSVFEEAGQQNTHHYFEKRMRTASFSTRVVTSKPPTDRTKETKIRDRLEPLLRSGKLYALLSQTELRKAIIEFPESRPIDLLDALAMAVEFAVKPEKLESMKANREILKKVLAKRNKVTGY